MIVLGIETSTARSSVAVLVDGVVVASEQREDARGHGAFLAPAMQRCASAVGGVTALDMVAVGTGPGLYTGIRVGMATAAALASARGLPVVGVGGLDVLARMADQLGDEAGDVVGAAGAHAVVTTLDARRGQVFWAVHAQQPPDPRSAAVGLRHAGAPCVGTAEQLDAVLAALAEDGPVQVLGEVRGAAVVRPDAVVLARLAVERWEAAGAEQARATFVPAALAAVYLRDADVRIGWNERGGVRAGGPS
jgi:tRNA threonylcarbamoyl adenosine modification protein YeaZ